jgi:hypothetical protein
MQHMAGLDTLTNGGGVTHGGRSTFMLVLKMQVRPALHMRQDGALTVLLYLMNHYYLKKESVYIMQLVFSVGSALNAQVLIVRV